MSLLRIEKGVHSLGSGLGCVIKDQGENPKTGQCEPAKGQLPSPTWEASL